MAEGATKGNADLISVRDLYTGRRYEEAFAAALALVKRDPNHTWAYCVCASCLAQMGRANEGLAVAEQAVALEPKFPLALTTRALCLHRLGRYSEAEADYERALAVGAEDFRIYYNFACYWAERGDETKCRQYFGQAIAYMGPGDAGDIAGDPDLARYQGREWFKELLAEAKSKKA